MFIQDKFRIHSERKYNMKLSLNREQLKFIAICSMVIDHVAWGFVEFYSPLGQFLHVLGRLTIPIMCFFIAEGFRKTSNLKAYIERMITFGIIAMIPFYIFFHEEYEYRTNFIFDLLFGLLALTVLESSLKKRKKVLLMILIFATSLLIGGWPITPTLFIIIFYYGRTFKEKVKWFVLADVATVLFLVVAILLNNVYHFSHYNWVWWDKFYQLGFILALPLLYCYNGEKGKPIIGRYFFYIFYCTHFLVLAGIKAIFVNHVGAFYIDLTAHILVLISIFILLVLTFRCRPSREQSAIIFFLTSAEVYIFGFILEIISISPDMFYLAILVEYFGEVMTFIGMIIFIKNLCKINVPLPVYMLQIVISLLIMYSILTTRMNGFFYKSIGIDETGPFPRLVLKYGLGFYLTITYIGILSLWAAYVCIRTWKIGTELDKKRVKMTLVGICLIWLPYLLKLLGLTGGYEIPGLGILLVSICFYQILIRYGFLDSVTLASESALDHGTEGIVVLSPAYAIQYHNKQLDDIFGEIPHNMDLRKHPLLGAVLSGQTDTLTINDRIYEFRMETLKDNGYEQGHMLWIHDSTLHHEALRQIREIATRDALTKLYNRVHYQDLIDTHFSNEKKGTFLMMDMDDFKKVNDQYGHQVGDEVLCALADVFFEYSEDILIGSRLGGDEFSVFIKDETDTEKVSAIIQLIMKQYQNRLEKLGYENYTSLSIGAVICDLPDPSQTDFATIYNVADKILYEVKQNGKHQFKLISLS